MQDCQRWSDGDMHYASFTIEGNLTQVCHATEQEATDAIKEQLRVVRRSIAERVAKTNFTLP